MTDPLTPNTKASDPAARPIPDTPTPPTPTPGPDLPPGPNPTPAPKPIPPAAQRALAEAEERRKKAAELALPPELGGRDGPEPVRYGDWEKKGLAVDF
ncbi:DUF1674 domain-containing protein [Sulfitobacter sp. M57]|nr:DUF1674 domain-containing protein [Sulfitobacter sp. KE5]MDF3422864.1 DUF1674 domain-containing protein [Sulfitobacter sp. KE43]MDF3433929.1 DUF1674 domain-containing protein [Sulfitobacter sp. KE42]MDF3459569.1 DUF1674 domain-containing protein [Sulfitobacter sp. S74]MDF3463468.1 DUF1674 domain-containing protein [Sulfitobacter sp. Ks18]MDF3467368.1 DUF1674 domain-containing protein [Sulfitobacter sp. M05]MDF3471263.1 DUF1674 domain-containing protein [Sulfitobacter sp. M28]MDF3475012.1 